jgi:predicted Zn-dependent protease
LKYGRDAERQSDELGVEYSSKIGYDAHQMAHFFNTLERQGAESGAAELPTFLSTHPNPGERNVTVDKLATEWQQKLNLANAQVNRNSYLQRIEGLIYGQDPREGYLENSIFYHPVLRFQFPVPSNWNYQNTPQQVQLISADGKALMLLRLAQGGSLQEAANAVLQQYKLQAVESRQVSVNGLNAVAMVADQPSQQQQAPALRTLSYLIQYGGAIYHLIGVSSINDFNNYSSLFTNVMQGFKELTDASKLNKKPERVHIRTLGQSATLQQALRQYNVPDKRMEEMAILNGMKLTDNLAQGTLIKVISE